MRRRKPRCVLIFWLTGWCALAASATIRVDPEGRGDFTEIQAALDAASAGDVVLVAPGEYVVDRALELNRLHDFEDPESPEVRDVILRSEAGAEATVIRRVHRGTDASAPGCVFYINKGETPASIIEGFTITGGKTHGRAGGGVYSDVSSPTFVDCVITRNVGGGLALGDEATVIGCTISSNTGDGVHCNAGSTTRLVDCKFIGNGGAPEIVAPAIYVDDGATVWITNCLVAGNGGIGLYCGEDNDSLTIVTNSTIGQNRGPGVYVDQDAVLRMTNSIVWGNAGGGLVPGLGSTEFGVRPEIAFSSVEGPAPWTGEGNIQSDPLFVALGLFDYGRFGDDGRPDFIVEPGDWRLRPGSPCIDRGSSEGAPETDLDGNPRPCGSGIDMGAYESCTPFLRRGDCNDDGEVNISDALCVLNWLFLGGLSPGCIAVTDANGDETADVSDPVHLLSHLFLGGPPPVPPFPACGPAPLSVVEELGCETPPQSCR